jgi:hypothetical protein
LDAASPPVRVSLCLDWATRDPQGQHADWCATMRVGGGLQAKTPAAETERGRPAIQCPCVSCSTINQAPTLVSDGMVFMAAREGGGWKLCDGFFFGAVWSCGSGERNGSPRRCGWGEKWFTSSPRIRHTLPFFFCIPMPFLPPALPLPGVHPAPHLPAPWGATSKHPPPRIPLPEPRVLPATAWAAVVAASAAGKLPPPLPVADPITHFVRPLPGGGVKVEPDWLGGEIRVQVRLLGVSDSCF